MHGLTAPADGTANSLERTLTGKVSIAKIRGENVKSSTHARAASRVQKKAKPWTNMKMIRAVVNVLRNKTVHGIQYICGKGNPVTFLGVCCTFFFFCPIPQMTTAQEILESQFPGRSKQIATLLREMQPVRVRSVE